MTPEQALGVAIVERAVMDLVALEDDVRADARAFFLGSTAGWRQSRDFWFDALGLDAAYVCGVLAKRIEASKAGQPRRVFRAEVAQVFYESLPDEPFRIPELVEREKRDVAYAWVAQLISSGFVERVERGVYRKIRSAPLSEVA